MKENTELKSIDVECIFMLPDDLTSQDGNYMAS